MMSTELAFGHQLPPPTDRKRSLIVQQNQRKKSISVTKAAVISSAMLARKNSLGIARGGTVIAGATNGSGINQQNSLNMPNKRDSMAAIADLLAVTSGGQVSKLRKPSKLSVVFPNFTYFLLFSIFTLSFA